jgi:hypothetical protein
MKRKPGQNLSHEPSFTPAGMHISRAPATWHTRVISASKYFDEDLQHDLRQSIVL